MENTSMDKELRETAIEDNAIENLDISEDIDPETLVHIVEELGRLTEEVASLTSKINEMRSMEITPQGNFKDWLAIKNSL